ncbi:MAG: efflux transporter periplasmic adaptor subunit [Solimicrobium sp.]|jgi:membrane fusion protein (multidrug efflux system)|nr:efflux transporter periplasmic adaptor subunit [Solimicrobium sp.]
MVKRMLIMLGCVLLLIALIALGKYLQIQKLIASQPKPGPVTVTTSKVAATEWQPQLSSVGTVTAFRGVDVSTEVGGIVREIKFKSGQNVKKGEVLFELNADSDIAYLDALQAQAELAKSVLKRNEAQLAVEGVSHAQVDSDKANLKNTRALVKQQEALVQKKTIRAPFSGRLGISLINPGQYIQAGEKLVSLQMTDPVYVNFHIPQKQLPLAKVGQGIVIHTDAFPEIVFPGKVNAINPVVDVTSRNVQVQATLRNEKQQLLPGMFAQVSLDVGTKNKLITLPQTAITYNPYGSTVFVAKPGQDKDDKGRPIMVVTQVFVTTGPARGDQVSIIKGLEEDQIVVTSGQLKLKNGMSIIVDNSVLPANDPNPIPQEN